MHYNVRECSPDMHNRTHGQCDRFVSHLLTRFNLLPLHHLLPRSTILLPMSYTALFSIHPLPLRHFIFFNVSRCVPGCGGPPPHSSPSIRYLCGTLSSSTSQGALPGYEGLVRALAIYFGVLCWLHCSPIHFSDISCRTRQCTPVSDKSLHHVVAQCTSSRSTKYTVSEHRIQCFGAGYTVLVHILYYLGERMTLFRGTVCIVPEHSLNYLGAQTTLYRSTDYSMPSQISTAISEILLRSQPTSADP
jgi:hypothetical protein